MKKCCEPTCCKDTDNSKSEDEEEPALARRVVAEMLGTAMLLATVVGSGIMAERLSNGNVALALLANAVATGAVLCAIILALGSISGAHFNPVVSICDAWKGGLRWSEVPSYAGAQITGAIAGVAVANAMFGEPPILFSHHVRHGFPQMLGEFVATFGLLVIIWGCSKYRAKSTPFAVAAYIVGAYWFTSSTAFANPAVTIARALTDSFSGIAPLDAPGFIVAEFLGAVTATGVFAWLSSGNLLPKEVVLRHSSLQERETV